MLVKTMCVRKTPHPPGKTRHGAFCSAVNMTRWSLGKFWMKED